MAIDGTTLIVRKFRNPENDNVVEVNLTLRDAILFQLLQDIVSGLRKRG